MLGIIDMKIPCCETKSIIFFLHAFFCKQRCRRHHEWCSPLWIKFVKKGPIFPTFFPNKRRWEWDCNIPSWAQRYFKKSFLALKNRQKQPKCSIRQAIIIILFFFFVPAFEKRFETWNRFAKFCCCWCNFQTVLILIYANERIRSNFLVLIQLKGK